MLRVMALVMSCFALLGMVAGCGEGSKTVATVNGKKISMKEYQQQARLLQSLYPGQPLDAASRRQVLEQMVKQELLVQAAEKQGLGAKADLKAKIEEQRLRYRQGLETQMENLKAQMTQLDDAVRSRILIEALLDADEKARPVADKDVKEFYARMKQQGLALRSFEEEKPRIVQQVVLDRLVAQTKEKADIDVKMELVSAGGVDLPTGAPAVAPGRPAPVAAK